MKYNKVFILILLLILLPISVDARSGCCSHHGGVSHCDTSVGKYRCNDGSVSPSCVCEGAVQTTKRKTTKKQITARPTTKRTTVNTTTTRIIPITTSYTTTVTTTEVIESETSTTTMTKVAEKASERTSENVKKENQNAEEDTSRVGIIGGMGVIGATAWYIAKKKKLV